SRPKTKSIANASNALWLFGRAPKLPHALPRISEILLAIGSSAAYGGRNGPHQQPSADRINIRAAAISHNRDADPVSGCETDPRAAIVSAPVFFQDAANNLVRSYAPSK